VFKDFKQLKHLWFEGNQTPMLSEDEYLKTVFDILPQLEELDGKAKEDYEKLWQKT